MSPGTRALSDCRVGWVCFWEWEDFTGAASSAVDLGPGERWNVPANLRGKISSAANNSSWSVYLYSDQCATVRLPAKFVASSLTATPCSGGGTWNNKLDYIERAG
ncbi:peptidase inhibitor family I36 protein [Streptomyces scopuliridis]|uniref:peptidase inhibitor family I36 protein n=1 Tax=Streptomyces scopuliridis TaxID=452529 RepID=UPI0035E15D68